MPGTSCVFITCLICTSGEIPGWCCVEVVALFLHPVIPEPICAAATCSPLWITAPLNNTRTLTFKARPTNAFFAAVNQVFGDSSKLPTIVERAVIKSFSTAQTTKQCSAVVGSWEEPPNIWLTVAKNAFVGWASNFKVCLLLFFFFCLLLKDAVRLAHTRDHVVWTWSGSRFQWQFSSCDKLVFAKKFRFGDYMLSLQHVAWNSADLNSCVIKQRQNDLNFQDRDRIVTVYCFPNCSPACLSPFHAH